MNLFGFFRERRSAPVARERLQILLAHERNGGCNADLIAILHREVLAAVSKHIHIDPQKVGIKMQRLETMSLLEIDIEVEAPGYELGVPARRAG
jgi:cell division topological specificity factor